MLRRTNLIEPFVILSAGIDTGIRKTFGFAVGTFLFFPESLNVVKAFKKTSLKTLKGKSELFRTLFNGGFIRFLPYYGETFNFSGKDTVEAVRTRLESLKNLESGKGNGSPVFGVEDFLFFNINSSQARRYEIRPASWFTVSKMQNVIGFITGYLSAFGYEVRIVKPSIWKRVVSPFYISFGSLVCEKFRIGKKDRDHVLSATGIATYLAIEEFISKVVKPEIICS